MSSSTAQASQPEADAPFQHQTKPRTQEKPEGDQLRQRVLVTGAAGNIGTYFAKQTHNTMDLRLMIHDESEKQRIDKLGEVIVADLSDTDSLDRACKGVQCILHLAANPSPEATWEDLQAPNITGMYNLMEAARRAGVQKVVFASSIHAISGCPADRQVRHDDYPIPGDMYGVTKCFGEALCAYYAHFKNIDCIIVRVGGFQPTSLAKGDLGIAMLDGYVSRRDLTQLLVRCINTSAIRFAVVHGLSNNRFKRMDISNARDLLGYEPIDDTTELNEELAKLRLDERVSIHNDDD